MRRAFPPTASPPVYRVASRRAFPLVFLLAFLRVSPLAFLLVSPLASPAFLRLPR